MNRTQKTKLIVAANDADFDKAILEPIRRGEIGSLLNIVDAELVSKFRRQL